ncbi:MAG TPA: LuxR C-terminal-related transcriptional regulator [Fimbriimonadaceae bacterium]|nr:LuxR C-terminal-related transcriptional regulator [Fimbriimonadaceae bacterium]
MAKPRLTLRENQIIDLCIAGLTNEGIAHKLGLGLGTVNSYWVRIKLKVKGDARADTVAKVLEARAAQNARELHAAIELLLAATGRTRSVIWATDLEFHIHTLARGEPPPALTDAASKTGSTIFDVFKSDDPAHPAIAAHRRAVKGEECAVELGGEFAGSCLRVRPMTDETGATIGCVAILSSVDR